MDEKMVRALLELGKVTFQKISEQALKIVDENTTADKTWLAFIPHEILQAYQGVHGHGANVAAARRLSLKEELGDEKGEHRFEVESADPATIFLLAGLSPPVDPIEVLLQCQVFVAAWKAHHEETKKGEHVSALALLSQIQKIREQYRVPDQSCVSVPEQV